jgi:hypothetical protein
LNVAVEKVATGILKHKRRLLIILGYIARANRPSRLEFSFQRVFVVYLLEGFEPRAFYGRR